LSRCFCIRNDSGSAKTNINSIQPSRKTVLMYRCSGCGGNDTGSVFQPISVSSGTLTSPLLLWITPTKHRLYLFTPEPFICRSIHSINTSTTYSCCASVSSLPFGILCHFSRHDIDHGTLIQDQDICLERTLCCAPMPVISEDALHTRSQKNKTEGGRWHLPEPHCFCLPLGSPCQ